VLLFIFAINNNNNDNNSNTLCRCARDETVRWLDGSSTDDDVLSGVSRVDDHGGVTDERFEFTLSDYWSSSLNVTQRMSLQCVLTTCTTDSDIKHAATHQPSTPTVCNYSPSPPPLINSPPTVHCQWDVIAVCSHVYNSQRRLQPSLYPCRGT